MFEKTVKILPQIPSRYKSNPRIDFNEHKINVLSFIRILFIFLKRYDMCFLSGTIIFEDDNSKLFNLLTYGLIKDGEFCDKDKAISNQHLTLTHMDIYKNPNVKSYRDDKCFKLNMKQKIFKTTTINKCNDNKCFKMELELNYNLNFLCDIEDTFNIGSKSYNDLNISPKQVILYYRYIYQGKKYLFFKLEQFPMEKIGHILQFLNQKRKDTYMKRRENETTPEYIKDFKIKDEEFYKKLFPTDIEQQLEKLKFYNDNLRTGRELFIIEEIKNMLLDNDRQNTFFNISRRIISYILISNPSKSPVSLRDIKLEIE
jgi:hypothetical protein